MADNTFKDNIYQDYIKKGFKGSQQEFDSLLSKPEVINSIYNDYSKLGFKGDLNSFSSLISSQPVEEPIEEQGMLDKYFGRGSFINDYVIEAPLNLWKWGKELVAPVKIQDKQNCQLLQSINIDNK